MSSNRLMTSALVLLALIDSIVFLLCRVRRVIYNQMKDFNAHHDGPKALWKNLAHQATTEELRNLLPSAVFGPVMTGDSYSSRRLFSLLFAGTIPVSWLSRRHMLRCNKYSTVKGPYNGLKHT